MNISFPFTLVPAKPGLLRPAMQKLRKIVKDFAPG